ncbi:MAG: hypothetical protein K6A44_07870 [bacterium]|nr:hypothetical protein [bacterium]
MIDWIEIFILYIQGEKPSYIAAKTGVEFSEIASRIKKEKWVQKREFLREKMEGLFEKKLERLAKKAFEQLEDILSDETASSTSKMQAAKTIIDIAGLKKDKKEPPKEVSYEVYINRKSVKCK